MKRIAKIRFLLSKNKQARRALVLVCLVLVMLGGIFTSVKLLDEKERVSAHPTNTIKLDEGGANEFEVPVDATQLEEDVLRIDLAPQFDDYVQSATAVPNTTKENVTAYGSNEVDGDAVNWSINDIKRTSNGNYIVLFGAAGYVKGGLIKISVFNPNGTEIGSTTLGTLTNHLLRIKTGFYENGNNSYLIGTTRNNFFKCTVESENNFSATLSLTELNTGETSSGQLKVHEVFKLGTEMKHNGKPIVTGPVYTTSEAREGIIKGRIPLGALDSQNWESGAMTGNVEHIYSLENLTRSELGLSNMTNEVIDPDLYMNSDNIVYGKISYSSNAGCDTVQIFSNTDKTVDGNTLKRREYSYVNANNGSECITILNDISSNDYIFFLAKHSTGTELIQVDLNTYDDRSLRTFPPDTRLLITTNNDGSLSYYGSTTSLEGEFYSQYYTSELNSPFYYIQGVMDGFATINPAKVRSLRAMELSNWLQPTHVMNTVTNEFLIAGQTTDYQTFPDSSYVIDETGGITEGIPQFRGAFLGLITVLDDNSPAIYRGSEMIDVDIDSDAIGNPSDTFENPGDTETYRGWNSLDRWLITGSENGKVTDSAAIKVYDHFDMDDPMLGPTIQEREANLQRRINRNPLDASAAINWNALGFDQTKSGAQLVTYFVPDSQGQVSVTSRWVNKKTSQTIEDNEYCLDAQNFHIPLTGLDTAIPDDATFKELAKTMAWNKTSSDIDEDGTDSSKLSSKVTIDATQLQALRDATEAKPYPVDVVYNAKSGVSITNRVWVFVTEENTVPNSEVTPNPITPADTNGVVIYANDYSLPYRMRNTHTNLEAVTSADVKVYDYFDSTHETDDELPTLADATKNASEITVDLQTIQDATEPETVRPSVSYTWQGTTDANHTNGTAGQTFVDVELTGNALLHIRQVVLDASNEIVVPTVGYFEVRNLLFDQDDPMNPPNLDPDYLATFTGKSGSDISNNEFTSVVVPTSHIPNLADQLQITVVVPEFYQYLGYWCTTEEADPGGAFHLTNTDYIDLPLDIFKGEVNDVGEYWITMFIKPNVDDNDNIKTPQPYSWDYKKNDLGKIKTITP